MKTIYIAWTAYQRRAASMQNYCDFDLYHIAPPFRQRYLKPIGHIYQGLVTLLTILRRRPDCIWVQVPPNFLLHLVFVSAILTFKKVRLVADCHNASLRKPWVLVPGSVYFLNKFNIVVVHNEEVRSQAIAVGVSKGRIVVLEDPPAVVYGVSDSGLSSVNYVLVPCSFHLDEPISELLQAASKLPDVQFWVTGNIYRAQALGYVQSAPSNVKFKGFIPLDQYDKVLSNAALVLGLTKLEGIQLSVASEAVGAARALLLSDTVILRSLFGRAARFTRHEPEVFAEGIVSALGDQSNLELLSRELCSIRKEEWLESMSIAQSKLIST